MGMSYRAANHRDKRKRHVWSLVPEKTVIVASERTRLMRMMEIM
jgi:hypothetical protein